METAVQILQLSKPAVSDDFSDQNFGSETNRDIWDDLWQFRMMRDFLSL